MINIESIPRVPDLYRVRLHLDNLPNKVPDKPIGIPGLHLLQRAEERDKYEDCVHFLYEGTVDPIEAFSEVLDLSRQTNLKPGSTAYYFDEEGFAVHVGLVTPDLEILSKWGRSGHIYSHLPQIVPLNYGSVIRYFEIPDSIKKDMIRLQF